MYVRNGVYLNEWQDTPQNRELAKSSGLEIYTGEVAEYKGQLYVKGLEPSQEEQESREAERIQNLTITKRVFALALKEFGISYTQLKDLIATSEDAQLEWDLCERLHRSNPLLDIMGAQMNITPDELNYIFQKANGEDVEPPVEPTEETEPTEPVEDSLEL